MSVTPGKIRLHDSAEPDLIAGQYTVRLDQRVAEFSPTPVERTLEVVAPRFALSGAEVASTFPPHQATGAFDTRLVQIVLKRRSLPWERHLGPAGAAASQPWLALVLLTAEEAEFLTGVPVTEVIPAAKHAELGVTAASGVCDCVQTSRDVVQAVFPRVNELGLLCHVREVSLQDTELAAGDLDGFFAVVLSARLPRQGQVYTAYLVSVEGREDALASAGGATTTTPGDVVVVPAGPRDQRFPVLARWSFTVAEGGDFESLAKALDNGAYGTAPGGCPGVSPTGHVATKHRSRRGEERAAWYRGPLTPREVERRAPVPLFSADQARRIAKDGMEDLSEAAAFELGRLLAMADPEFVAALQQWRRSEFQAGAAAETFGFVPGVTDLGIQPPQLRTSAPRLLTLAALTSLGSATPLPLGTPVPRAQNPVPITTTDILAIAAGLGLDDRLVEGLLRSDWPGRLTLPVEAGTPLSRDFQDLIDNPDQLAHLQHALRERITAATGQAGLGLTTVFDPAAPAATLDEIFSGGTP